MPFPQFVMLAHIVLVALTRVYPVILATCVSKDRQLLISLLLCVLKDSTVLMGQAKCLALLVAMATKLVSCKYQSVSRVFLGSTALKAPLDTQQLAYNVPKDTTVHLVQQLSLSFLVLMAHIALCLDWSEQTNVSVVQLADFVVEVTLSVVSFVRGVIIVR